MKENLLCDVSFLNDKEYIGKKILQVPMSTKSVARVVLAPRRAGKTSLMLDYIQSLISSTNKEKKFCILACTVNLDYFISKLEQCLHKDNMSFVVQRNVPHMAVVTIGKKVICISDSNTRFNDPNRVANFSQPDAVMVDEGNSFDDAVLYSLYYSCKNANIDFYAFGSDTQNINLKKKSIWAWFLNHPEISVEKSFYSIGMQRKILNKIGKALSARQLKSEFLIDLDILHALEEKEKEAAIKLARQNLLNHSYRL